MYSFEMEYYSTKNENYSDNRIEHKMRKQRVEERKDEE